MIDYSANGLGYIFRCTGSVFPKASKYAFPNAVLGALLHYLMRDYINELGIDGMESLWSGYTFVLGFLVVFRNNQAYSRFWEGANAMSVIRSEFLNGIGSALAFTDQAPEMKSRADSFQAQICKLGSMLFAASVQQVCELDDDDALQILNVKGLDKEKLRYLSQVENKPEVLMLWMERLVIENLHSGLLKAPPPIISRIYQEFGNGMVQLQKVRNIKEVPFPFPYAQMISVMLIVHWLVTPFLALNLVQGMWWAGALCFFLTGSMWSLILIAQEIDQPFGDDPNDLPVKHMMQEFNTTLIEFLHPFSQQPPEYTHDAADARDMSLSSWTVAGQAIVRHTVTYDEPVSIDDSAMRENQVQGAAVDVQGLDLAFRREAEMSSVKPIVGSYGPDCAQQATQAPGTTALNSEVSPTCLQAPSSCLHAHEATEDHQAIDPLVEKLVRGHAEVNEPACLELAGLAPTQTPATVCPDSPHFSARV